VCGVLQSCKVAKLAAALSRSGGALWGGGGGQCASIGRNYADDATDNSAHR